MHLKWNQTSLRNEHAQGTTYQYRVDLVMHRGSPSFQLTEFDVIHDAPISVLHCPKRDEAIEMAQKWEDLEAKRRGNHP